MFNLHFTIAVLEQVNKRHKWGQLKTMNFQKIQGCQVLIKSVPLDHFRNTTYREQNVASQARSEPVPLCTVWRPERDTRATCFPPQLSHWGEGRDASCYVRKCLPNNYSSGQLALLSLPTGCLIEAVQSSLTNCDTMAPRGACSLLRYGQLRETLEEAILSNEWTCLVQELLQGFVPEALSASQARAQSCLLDKTVGFKELTNPLFLILFFK